MFLENWIISIKDLVKAKESPFEKIG